MLKIKSIMVLGLVGVVCSVWSAEAATPKWEDMIPPKRIENKVYDAMIGTWQAKNTEMMGKKMNQITKIRWAFNHQYIIMNVKATEVGHPKSGYEGMGIFGVDSTNKAKTFWFDDWGVDAMSTGAGEFGDNSLTLTDSNANFKESRTFEIKGKEMIMHAKGNVIMNGKEMPFDITTVYRKK